jgi:hypothetical protein
MGLPVKELKEIADKIEADISRNKNNYTYRISNLFYTELEMSN